MVHPISRWRISPCHLVPPTILSELANADNSGGGSEHLTATAEQTFTGEPLSGHLLSATSFKAPSGRHTAGYNSSGWSIGASDGPLFSGEPSEPPEAGVAEADARFADCRTVIRAFTQVSGRFLQGHADDRSILVLDRAEAAAQAFYDDSQRAMTRAGALLNVLMPTQLNPLKRQKPSQGRQPRHY
jgi:hypothetical protein